MKFFIQFAFFLPSLLVFSSCDKGLVTSGQTNDETIHVILNQNEPYSINLKAGGDEQGASIKSQALHASKSEIERGAATNFEVYYHYQPLIMYSGKDQVTINVCNEDDGTGYGSTCHLLIIYFDIK